MQSHTYTSVRKVPEEFLTQYRLLAAQLVIEKGEAVSMNSLYVKALKEYLDKPANRQRLARL